MSYEKEGPLEKFFYGDGINSPFMKYFNKVVSCANMVLSSVAMWMCFTLVFRNNMPLVVVLSDSMKPNFVRGDLLLATGTNTSKMFETGQICAYNIETSSVPIVHRMIETHKTSDHNYILTKGDNNLEPDNWLYRGAAFYRNEEVETKLVAVLPAVGWVSILVKSNRYVSILFIIFLFYNSFRNPDN